MACISGWYWRGQGFESVSRGSWCCRVRSRLDCRGSWLFRCGLITADDQVLTLRSLLQVRLRDVRLAVLSACETAISGLEVLEESLSLPSGLVQAGAGAAISPIRFIGLPSATSERDARGSS
jgi:hypothetical protein